ncbi:MAG: hypothetical protein ABTQ29_02040, partial [Siculibacillus sp.]
WSPERGLRVAGMLSFVPQPGTGWDDLDPDGYDNIIEALSNEAVYKAASKLLGDELNGVVTGLLVGGGTEQTVTGVFYASGCVPHACGAADAFMAVDANGRKLYFAQTGDRPEPNAWPALKTWPPAIRSARSARRFAPSPPSSVRPAPSPAGRRSASRRRRRGRRNPPFAARSRGVLPFARPPA